MIRSFFAFGSYCFCSFGEIEYTEVHCMTEADLSGLKIKTKPYLTELIDVSQFK